MREEEDGSAWVTVLDSWVSQEIVLQDADFGAVLVDNAKESNSQSIASISVKVIHPTYLNAEVRVCVDELLFAWDDLCSVFDSLYVNWDPKMFEYQTNFHGYISFPRIGPRPTARNNAYTGQ